MHVIEVDGKKIQNVNSLKKKQRELPGKGGEGIHNTQKNSVPSAPLQTRNTTGGGVPKFKTFPLRTGTTKPVRVKPFREEKTNLTSNEIWDKIMEDFGCNTFEDLFVPGDKMSSPPRQQILSPIKSGVFRMINRQQTQQDTFNPSAQQDVFQSKQNEGLGLHFDDVNEPASFGNALEDGEFPGMIRSVNAESAAKGRSSSILKYVPSPVRISIEKFQENANIQEFDGDDGEPIWTDRSTLQGVGVLPDGTLVYGEDTNSLEVRLASLVIHQSQSRNPESYQEYIDECAKQLADEWFDNEEDQQDWIDKATKPEYYDIPDVTEDVMSLLFLQEAKYKSNLLMSNYTISFIDFILKVQSGGDFDLKNQDAFQQNQLFVFDGEIVSRDALGNIAFGYLSKVYNIPENVAFGGAGAAQLVSGNFDSDWIETLWDDPRDAVRVAQGMDLYREAKMGF